MQLALPALPARGFSHSYGLETALEAGLADTEDRACTWLLDQLDLGLARSDLAVAATFSPELNDHLTLAI